MAKAMNVSKNAENACRYMNSEHGLDYLLMGLMVNIESGFHRFNSRLLRV